MEFGGRYLFATQRDAVWAALNDVAVLGAAIPGCQRIDWAGPNALEIDIKVNLGLLQPVFSGDLELSNIVPAKRYTLTGRGRGPMLGMARAAADVVLADATGGTELRFLAEGGADGAIMKLGRALLGNSAQKVIDGFFQRIGATMGVAVTTLDR